MAIEVLLRRTIEGVGQVGEVVRVRPGYARNYLLPRESAALVTPESLRRVDKDKAAEAIRQTQLQKERAALLERLSSVTVTVEARAGEDGHLYGSVGARQVLDGLKRQGYALEERHVHFEPVRELGEYEVAVHLTKDQTTKIRLWVVQDAQDAVSQAESKAAADAAAQAKASAEPPAAEPSAPAKSSPA
jgi:large subunit ribosomal protein L9